MGIGGSERVCVNLSNEWASLGHEVNIVTLNLDNDIYTDKLDCKVRVHTLGVSRLRYAAFPMLSFINRHNPDFFLVFGNEMAVIINKLRKLRLVNIPIIVRVLNNVNISLAKEDNISPVVEKYLQKSQGQLRQMNYVVAQCESMGRQLLAKGIVDEKQMSVIYNPVSNDLIDKVNSIKAYSRSVKNILFVGRIDPQKNPKDLIEAFELVHTSEAESILHIAGNGVLESQIRELVDSKGLHESVIFHGICNDMEKLYSIADVVVLSSDYEGMPNCLIEAIGCGIPVVSYDCPIGPSEIVVEGVNGYLSPLGEVPTLAGNIIKALQRQWDKEAIKATCDKFRVDKIAERYIDIFNKFANE